MITQEYLKELFDYDGEDLIWKVKRNGTKGINTIAGSVSKSHGYRIIEIDDKNYRAHRLIWLYHYGKFPDNQIDHIDQDKLNNCINNLRDVTHRENGKNQSKPKNNTSGITGVYWHKPTNKLMAYGKIDSKQKGLGLFTEKWDAICARKSWEARNGFHENHGN